jgi:N-acetyl-anhydromuramyl-L-alanine amidase AmpD
MIGENLNTRDFSIGFTDTKSDAHVIISDNSTESDLVIVKSRLSEANLSVIYGEKLINPSVRIEVMENGTVDFLVYNESESFDVESLILAFLPIINAQIGHSFDVIPYWGSEEEPVFEEEQEEQEIKPTYYAGINLAHWITSIEEGVIQLDDNSLFIVYEEDRYISKLWQNKNDVVVTPTEVAGHYYITKDGGIYKEVETLRAICIKGN